MPPATPRADTVVRVAEGLDLVLISADEVLVQFGTRSYPSELLRDTDLNGILATIVARLHQGPATIAQLLSEIRTEHRTEAGHLIEDLLGRGILADSGASPVEQYLGYTFTGETALGDHSVSVIGAGPIGGRLAHTLLQHGLGRVSLLDDRPAGPLWHTFMPFGPAGVGPAGVGPAGAAGVEAGADGGADRSGGAPGPAHAALRHQLLAAGHSAVESLDARLDLDGIAAAVDRSDLVVVALEQPDLRLSHLVNRVCLRAGRPWMLACVDGNFGLVGPLFLPRDTACYNDFRALADAATPSPEMAREHRRHVLRRERSSFFPGLPAYPEIVSGHAALAIVSYLLRGTSFALGRVLVIDFDRMLIDVEDVLRLPRCPVCGNEKSAYRQPSPIDLRVTASRTDG